MIACSCSNPGCMLYGCQAARKMQTEFAPYPPGPRIGMTVPAPPSLSEEDIRRIIREELTKAKE